MKPRRSPSRLLFLFLLFPAIVLAQGGPPSWAGAGNHGGNGAHAAPPAGAGDMAALDYFLGLSDAQLEALATAIDRVRAMTPEERQAMRERIAAYRELPAPEREKIRSGWASDADWEDWRTMMAEKSPDERAAIQAALQAMPFEERAAYKNTLLEAWREARSAAQ